MLPWSEAIGPVAGQHGFSGVVSVDRGVSFWSAHDPRSALTCTVISNSSDDAWPIAQRLNELLPG